VISNLVSQPSKLDTLQPRAEKLEKASQQAPLLPTPSGFVYLSSLTSKTALLVLLVTATPCIYSLDIIFR